MRRTAHRCAALYDGAARWLAPWRRQLAARADLRGRRAWWSLFRTEGGGVDRNIVSCGATSAAAARRDHPSRRRHGAAEQLLRARPAPSLDDALALVALLNSRLAAAWLNAIAEPARGGWHRYLGWTMSLLPLPADWPRARTLLAPIAERAIQESPPTELELLDAVCRAYRLKHADVAPLLAWEHRS